MLIGSSLRSRLCWLVEVRALLWSDVAEGSETAMCAVERVHKAGGRERSKLCDWKNKGIYVCTSWLAASNQVSRRQCPYSAPFVGARPKSIIVLMCPEQRVNQRVNLEFIPKLLPQRPKFLTLTHSTHSSFTTPTDIQSQQRSYLNQSAQSRTTNASLNAPAY